MDCRAKAIPTRRQTSIARACRHYRVARAMVTELAETRVFVEPWQALDSGMGRRFPRRAANMARCNPADLATQRLPKPQRRKQLPRREPPRLLTSWTSRAPNIPRKDVI